MYPLFQKNGPFPKGHRLMYVACNGFLVWNYVFFYFQRYNPASAGSLARIKWHRVHNTLRTADKLYSDCINWMGQLPNFLRCSINRGMPPPIFESKHPSLRCACTLVSIFGCYIGRTQLTVEASAGCWLLSVQQLSTIMYWDRKQMKQFLTGHQVCVRVREENVNKLSRPGLGLY